MIQAFYTGITGLKSGQSAIDVTADNIANVSTVGFRGYDSEFASLYEDAKSTVTTSSSTSTIGAGVRLQATTIDLSQGSYALSDRSTDMAIEGDGWFGVVNKGGAEYTRAGAFTFDQNSDLVTVDGFYVLGSMGGNIDLTTNTLTEVLQEVPLKNVSGQEKLSFPNTLTYPQEPTTYASYTGNIGRLDEDRSMGADVIDSEGNRNNLKLTFSMSVPQVSPGSQWDVVATTQTLDGTTVYDTQSGVVNFNAQGGLISTTLTSIDNNGAQVDIDLGNDYNGIISVANSNTSSSSESDGTIAGDLVGYEINQYAEVVATFSNGYQSTVGQVAVYHFYNDSGLERASGARFTESVNSGEPTIFKDANGVNTIGASVMTYRLENSNVTLDKALTELIVLQRSYDANSKSISTADQMIQKALQMGA